MFSKPNAIALALFLSGASSAYAGTTSYKYDELGRLIEVDYPDSSAATYQYDAAGNRTQVNKISGASCVAPASVKTVNDFNGDHLSDFLIKDQISGNFSEWRISSDATGIHDTPNISTWPVSAGWNLVGSFDFNGDGASDLLWQNAASGQLTVWLSSGSGFISNAYTDATPTPDTVVAGFGDFDGDGRVDMLLRSPNGTFREWKSTGSSFAHDVYVDSSVDSTWHVQTIADFNGDGKADILWRNNSGMITEWQSTGNGFAANVYQNTNVDTTWHVAAVGDFNGDGKSDIIWRNDSGSFTEWQSTGNGFTPNVYSNSTVDSTWHLVGAYDFNGDGKADLLWQNDSGTFTIWLSTGNGFSPNTLIDQSQPHNMKIVCTRGDVI